MLDQQHVLNLKIQGKIQILLHYVLTQWKIYLIYLDAT